MKAAWAALVVIVSGMFTALTWIVVNQDAFFRFWDRFNNGIPPTVRPFEPPTSPIPPAKPPERETSSPATAKLPDRAHAPSPPRTSPTESEMPPVRSTPTIERPPPAVRPGRQIIGQYRGIVTLPLLIEAYPHGFDIVECDATLLVQSSRPDNFGGKLVLICEHSFGVILTWNKIEVNLNNTYVVITATDPRGLDGVRLAGLIQGQRIIGTTQNFGISQNSLLRHLRSIGSSNSPMGRFDLSK